jgi:hypothetical protein
MASASPLIEPTQEVVSQTPSRSVRRTHLIVLLVVWAISCAYMATHVKRSWVPHDEGTLGLSAERVLNGELPHRDFDDYTGGLTYVHALAFRELGTNSSSMRIVLFAFFVAWVPAVFYIASRFSSAYSAGAVALLAVVWSVPIYPGPMPSWYNLFFATFGTAALLRYLEVGSRRWLIVAGACGGLSFLAKITAAYFVAGALLFFIFCEQSIAGEKNGRSGARARLYSSAVAVALGIFLVLLFNMIRKVPGTSVFFHFFLPAFALIVLLLSREFAGIAGQNRERFTTLMGMCLPFGLGFAIPLLVFLIPFVVSGAVHDLLYGIVALPTRSIRFAAIAPVSPINVLTIAPFIAPVLIGYEVRKVGRMITGGILAMAAGAILIFSEKHAVLHLFGWYSLRTAVPVLVLSGAAILWVAGRQGKLSVVRQQQIVLILCVTALCSLVQFPFGAEVYFIFVAPLLILSANALFASAARPPRFVLGVLAGFYLLFGVLRIVPGFINHLGFKYAPDAQTERLTIERAGGLRVEARDAQVYEALIPLVQAHAAGKFMYAAPDCPEVYFLSGLKSPTRHYFDAAEDPVDHTARTLQLIENLHVNVVAINKEAQFSGQLSTELQNELEQRYPHSKDLGHFEVRWKELEDSRKR